MNRELILKADKVSKVFKKKQAEVSVLKEVDLELYEGEMLAITGSSGAGKSTLLHILGTLEKPTSGKVFFGPEKQDVFSLSDEKLSWFRNRNLGFIFQFHHLLPEFDATENVMMPALIAGQSKASAEKAAKELLGFVGLSHRLKHKPSELSGGEQQRVAIARAVILRPKLILADELTGNLDSENGAMVMDLLQKLNQTMKVSIALITHDQTLAKKMHRIVFMKDGQVES